VQRIENLRISGGADDDLPIGEIVAGAEVGVDPLNPNESRKSHLGQARGFNAF